MLFVLTKESLLLFNHNIVSISFKDLLLEKNSEEVGLLLAKEISHWPNQKGLSQETRKEQAR